MLFALAVAHAAPLTVAFSDATLSGDAVTIRPLDGAAAPSFGAIHVEGNSGEEIVIGGASLQRADGRVFGASDLAAAPIDAIGFTTTEDGCIVDGAAAIVGVDGGGIIKGEIHEGAERTGGGIIKGEIAEGAERTGGGIIKGQIHEGAERTGGGIIKGEIIEGAERTGGGIIRGEIIEGAERTGGGIIKGQIQEGAERTGGGHIKGEIAEGAERTGTSARYCADTGPDCFAAALVDGTDGFAPAVVIEDAMLSAWFDGATTCAVEVWSEGRLMGEATGACTQIAALTAATAPWDVFAATVDGVPQVTLGWTGGTDDPAAR